MGFKLFRENLFGLTIRNVKVLIDKSFYIILSVLELPMLHMYRFQYEYIAPKYGRKGTLLFTDPDSLIYEIERDEAYMEMFNYSERFDLANYPGARDFYDPSINKV